MAGSCSLRPRTRIRGISGTRYLVSAKAGWVSDCIGRILVQWRADVKRGNSEDIVNNSPVNAGRVSGIATRRILLLQAGMSRRRIRTPDGWRTTVSGSPATAHGMQL